MVWQLGKKPWEKMLQAENGIQQRAEKAEEHEAGRLLSERHFSNGINRSDTIEQPLNRTAEAIEHSTLPGKNAFYVSTQGLYKNGDDDDEQEVVRSGVEIRHLSDRLSA